MFTVKGKRYFHFFIVIRIVQSCLYDSAENVIKNKKSYQDEKIAVIWRDEDTGSIRLQ